MLNRPAAEAAPHVGAALAESYRVVAGRADAGLVILCDHAENAFPLEYGTLGLPPAEIARHIAYDIGAAGIVERLARELEAPAVLSRFSRLLIDLNRGADDPTLIMRFSDGAVIPGNRHLDDTERKHRFARFYEPYHRAVTEVVDRCQCHHAMPVLLSIHSFTEVWRGEIRPWQVGVLWDSDRRLAGPMIEELLAEGDLLVGDNEPYSGKLQGDTMWRHGTMRGLPHALIEVRQDLIRDVAGQAEWAHRLARVLRRIAARHAELGLDIASAEAAHR
ncbi:MAG: N-formylglutamate amidohydrolase [Pseudomonadota bacterium]